MQLFFCSHCFVQSQRLKKINISKIKYVKKYGLKHVTVRVMPLGLYPVKLRTGLKSTKSYSKVG